MRTERHAAADYVAALSTELAGLARQHGLDVTAYMLEVAAAEAASATPGAMPKPADNVRRPLDELVAALVPES